MTRYILWRHLFDFYLLPSLYFMLHECRENIYLAHYILSSLIIVTSLIHQLYSWNIIGGPHIFLSELNE